MSAMQVDREQIIAYRLGRHGLFRDGRATPALLDLGIQQAGSDSARLALAARGMTGDDLVLAWTLRGAPHLHRAPDLPRLAAALWPRSEADAMSRLSWQRGRVRQAGMPAVAALAEAVRGMHAAVTSPMTKGAASAATTTAVPDGLAEWCRGCQATHIHEQLFRLTALPAGLRIDRAATPLTLTPIDAWPGAPQATDAAAQADLVRAYLDLHGPASPSEAAGFLGSTPAQTQEMWPQALVEVSVAGRSTWLPEDRLADLRDPQPAELVRLLPPHDPYLQARDRLLLLPDKEWHPKLWRTLGNPGAVLVDGEIAGVWRASKKGSSKQGGRLELTVQPFWRLTKQVRAAIEREAQLMAEVRGVVDAQVRYD